MHLAKKQKPQAAAGVFCLTTSVTTKRSENSLALSQQLNGLNLGISGKKGTSLDS